jgi:hypothetical protein
MAKRPLIIPKKPTGEKDASGAYLPPPQVLKPSQKLINLGNSFPIQQAFTEDTSRYIAAQCSRRAGKTNGLAIRFLKAMEKHPKSQSVYLSLTLESARDIMWPVLHELNDKHDLGCTFLDSKLTMTYPNGATLKLFGADMKNFIKRLKGRKFPAVAVDEAQDFGSHLESLVDDVLTPSISDYSDGWIALTGTPGPVPQGYFFEVTQERKYGFSLHQWTVLDNPYMPEPAKFIEDLKKKREWDDNHPTLLREWKNKWVLDPQSLWIQYKADVDHYDALPVITPSKFTYVLGIDLGFRDADALAVVAWSDKEPNTYLVEEVVTPKQGLTGLVKQINELRNKYDFVKMVIDEGGLGKKIAEEIRVQHVIPVQPAEKALKQQNVEFLNDALRLGRFKAHKDSRFAQDSYLIQIDWDKSTADRIVVKKDPHSDIIDAVLYAFRESPAFTYREPPKKPAPGTKEWFDAQQSALWELAMDHFKKQENYDPYE